MIGRVAGSMYAFKRPAVIFEQLSMVYLNGWPELKIVRFFNRVTMFVIGYLLLNAAAENRRTAGCSQWPTGW